MKLNFRTNSRSLDYKYLSKKLNNNKKSNIKPKLGNLSLSSNIFININMFRCPNDTIKRELKDMKRLNRETENSKDNSKKVLITNANLNIAKENIIVSLRKELKYQKLLNKNLTDLKIYADKKYNFYKKNYDDIIRYRTQLENDLSEFLNIMKAYEKSLEDCEENKKMTMKTNDDIINYKKIEQKNLMDKLNKLNNETEEQSNKIANLDNKIKEFGNMNHNYIIDLGNNEINHDKKYQMLLDEYKRVENQYKYYFDLELKRRKNNLDKDNKNLCSEEEGNAMMKLNDKQVKNNFLKHIVSEIQTQIKEIEKINERMNEDNKIVKLLGKTPATEKYKQKLSMKYQNEFSNINSKFNMTLSSF